MLLAHVEGPALREPQGFMFYMQVRKTSQTIRVFVADEVLTGGDDAPDKDLQAQLETERAELEAVACEKYNHGHVTADGLIVIALSDIAGMIL
jgi:hypothetical protein